MPSTYATLTLADLKENLYGNQYESIGKKIYYNNIKTKFIRSWKRYRDDCFIFGNANAAILTIYIIYSKTYIKIHHRTQP